VDSVEDQRGHVNQKQMCERSLVPTTRMVVKTIAPFHINQELFVTEYRLLRDCCAVLVCRCVCSCAGVCTCVLVWVQLCVQVRVQLCS
jgi:hypothetical protein